MKWFKNNKKKLEMIQSLRPTSKSSLKMQCLFASKGDIEEARNLYNFFAEDIATLPDYDPAPQTWVDTTKETARSFFSWLKENQGTIAQGYEMVRQMTGGKLPPLMLPGTVTEAESAAAPIPNINE